MKRLSLLSIVLLVTMLCSLCGNAFADYVVYASPTFSQYTINLSSTGTASFSATTTTTCSSIKVSSCTLQIKSGSSWSDTESLIAPAGATNTSKLKVSKSYSGSMTSGKTYRIKAVFNADGSTVTAYSGGINY